MVEVKQLVNTHESVQAISKTLKSAIETIARNSHLFHLPAVGVKALDRVLTCHILLLPGKAERTILIVYPMRDQSVCRCFVVDIGSDKVAEIGFERAMNCLSLPKLGMVMVAPTKKGADLAMNMYNAAIIGGRLQSGETEEEVLKTVDALKTIELPSMTIKNDFSDESVTLFAMGCNI